VLYITCTIILVEFVSIFYKYIHIFHNKIFTTNKVTIGNKIKSSISKIIHLANSLKTQEVMGLFVLLVALLFLSSKQQVQLFFHSFLGRIVVVSLVALFASHNNLLGISAVLVVLCIVQTI